MAIENASQFRTFQTPQNYEAALSRHAQKVRWLQATTCPCISIDTNQPDPSCSVCRGRGYIYKNPTVFYDYEESVRHTNLGRVYPSKKLVSKDRIKIYRKGELLEVDLDKSTETVIQLKQPFPKTWEVLSAEYYWTPLERVEKENSKVIGTNVIQINTVETVRDRRIPVSLESVEEVRNATKDEVLTVSGFAKNFIYVQDMLNWEEGDTLEVTYTYVPPFDFLLVGVTGRIRYEQPYVLEDSDVVLVTPYWAQIGANDLITALSVNRLIDTVVDDVNDVHTFKNIFDIEEIVSVIDQSANVYASPDVVLQDRNSMKWNIQNHPEKYTVKLKYHPTYTALTNLQGIRSAENKLFANRIGLKQYDILTDKVVF